MTFQKAPRGERLADLREAIAGQVQMKKYYASFSSPAERERQINEAKRLRDNAAKIVAQAERIEAACADWRAGYEKADQRVMELRAELLATENEKQIDRVDDLVARMVELMS